MEPNDTVDVTLITVHAFGVTYTFTSYREAMKYIQKFGGQLEGVLLGGFPVGGGPDHVEQD